MVNLNDLQNELIQGQKLSMQGSDQRRAPEKIAIPYLLSARKGLKEFVKQNEDNSLAWRLLSQAEEYLLNYNEAINCLQKVIELGGKDRKDRKDLRRLVMLKENGRQWQELNISPEQLELLGRYLEQKVESSGCNHTLTHTKEWLDENIPKNKKSKVIKSIQNQGGFCDCEVLMNVID
ncbi:DUF2695 domain-containing protein [Paenisporosarcina sp. TG20]|uniref:DUF2695 domain-containing protein n=1 Tax=Paenisporosarcina sp. TG20 TaxID=1211706 RepID=UPI0002D2C379|nr:DUF2695 domain-containing protein [Paenisporosarcina sp. TG20]